MEKLIKVSDAAKKLGVSRQTIENWGKAGVITIIDRKHVHYVSSDRLDELTQDMLNVEEARRLLQEEKERYIQEKQNYDNWKKELEGEYQANRLKEFTFRRFVKTAYFETINDLLHFYGSIDDREHFIIETFIRGKTISEIADNFSFSESRVYNILKKAVVHILDIEKIKYTLERSWDLEDEVNTLKHTVENLKGIIHQQTLELANFRAKKYNKLNEEEKEIVHLCKLFSTKLIDYNFSVRSLNGFKSLDIETVGDLIKRNRAELKRAHGIGSKSLTEISDFLDSMNLEYGTDVDKYYEALVEIEHLNNNCKMDEEESNSNDKSSNMD